MRFIITGDCNAESGVGEVIDEISGPTKKHFVVKNYGASLLGIGVILMCRSQHLKFKQRIRLSKKDKMLFMDIMFNIDEMKPKANEVRRRIIFQRLSMEVPEIVSKYKLSDFNVEQFTSDLNSWFYSLGNN